MNDDTKTNPPHNPPLTKGGRSACSPSGEAAGGETPPAGEISLKADSPLGGGDLPEDLEDLWMYLKWFCQGRAHAKTVEFLGRRLGIKGRHLREQCAELNKLGYPVASSCSREPLGIFVAITQEEKDEYCRQLKSRIVETAKRLRAFGNILTEEELLALQEGKIPAQLELNL